MPEQTPQEEPVRQRHGLATFWLIYLIINGLTAIITFTYLRKDVEEFLKTEFSDEYCQYLIGIGILTAISAFLILQWKKVGFHGIIISSILSLYLSLQMGASIGSSLLGLTQIAITYMVLQVRKNGKSAWEWLN